MREQARTGDEDPDHKEEELQGSGDAEGVEEGGKQHAVDEGEDELSNVHGGLQSVRRSDCLHAKRAEALLCATAW